MVDFAEMGEIGWKDQQRRREITGRRTVQNVYVQGDNIAVGEETIISLYQAVKHSRLVYGELTIEYRRGPL